MMMHGTNCPRTHLDSSPEASTPKCSQTAGQNCSLHETKSSSKLRAEKSIIILKRLIKSSNVHLKWSNLSQPPISAAPPKNVELTSF